MTHQSCFQGPRVIGDPMRSAKEDDLMTSQRELFGKPPHSQCADEARLRMEMIDKDQSHAELASRAGAPASNARPDRDRIDDITEALRP
jgi:hypothetical protein